MKKVVVVFALMAILVAGTAFADHPGGWGVGVMGRYGFGWGGYGGALSLKVPSIPLYWGINLGANEGVLQIGLSGDYFMFDKPLVTDIKLHWFLGLGAFGDFTFYDGGIYIGAGARVPVGLSWQPVDLIEVFIDAAPSLGVGINLAENGGLKFPLFGVPIELGLRLWF